MYKTYSLTLDKKRALRHSWLKIQYLWLCRNILLTDTSRNEELKSDAVPKYISIFAV